MVFKHSVRIHELKRACYCTKTPNNKIYSNTVILPKTKFPSRLESDKLISRDKYIYNVSNLCQIKPHQCNYNVIYLISRLANLRTFMIGKEVIYLNQSLFCMMVPLTLMVNFIWDMLSIK